MIIAGEVRGNEGDIDCGEVARKKNSGVETKFQKVHQFRCPEYQSSRRVKELYWIHQGGGQR